MRKLYRNIIVRMLCLAVAPLLLAQKVKAQEQTLPARDIMADTWVATDALGRAVPTGAYVGAPKSNRTVGMFYFLWQGEQSRPIFDITKLIAANPANPQWGGMGAFHWWGEPWFGYYRNDDPYIIRKHAQMLSDAGVDVLFFDNTNGLTYPTVYTAICREFTALRAQGVKTPSIAFFPNQVAAETLWKEFYSKSLYQDLWFQWPDDNGKMKPLFLLKPEVDLTKLPAEAQEFFTIRRSWAWSAGGWFGDGKDKWPWLDHSPQKFGWHDAPDKPEAMAVATAQHATTSIGRSYQNGKEPPVDKYHLTPTVGQGLYFTEQSQRALEIEPPFVFITGWNEWIAQRFTSKKDEVFAGLPQKTGDTTFVDQFNEEFSRDIEPVKGAIDDNYLYQLHSFIRQYKGAREVGQVVAMPIRIDGDFNDWQNAAPEFRDTLGDPAQREHPGWGDIIYKNNTGRNDLLNAKVAYDANNAYFYVQTQNTLSAPTGANWMMLFLDSDNDPTTGWLGYDFRVSRSADGKTTEIAANVNDKYQWGKGRALKSEYRGNQMEIAVPRWIFGDKGQTIDFKWADNLAGDGTVEDFTVNGDVAPNDRFNYRAVLGK